MDYDLSRLSWRSFEQLVQAIGSEVLGPGLIVFGDGPDGGREATIHATVPYPTELDKWTGYTLVQAKFLQKPQRTGEDGRWAVAQLSEELSKYGEHASRNLPDNMIFVTNVNLSAVETIGAKDKVFAIAAEAGLENFDVWDYDKIRIYLDKYKELRRSFGPYVLSGDVLAEMLELLEEVKTERPDFDEVMSRFLQKELIADQWVNLEQAGRSTEEQVPVSRVFVDLPVSDMRQPDPPTEDLSQLAPGFVAKVLETASVRLDPESLSFQKGARDADDARSSSPESRLVLVGGPGQGKTTIGQFVCQMFRASLLRSRDQTTLAPEVKDTLGALEGHCSSDGLDLPSVRRFPVRVELTKFADELGDPQGCDSLLSYVAGLISARIDEPVTAGLMAKWLGSYPWLLILDGLDEVPASGNREELMTAIREFWVDIAEATADCLVIATTRPQGYEEEFSPRYYRHYYLTPLSTSRALHYAERLLRVRFATDADRRADISGRLSRAAARSDTRRLMTSPLQVTIMATLLERMGQPPEGRWNLFSQYYRVIYDRELEREISAAWVLRDHRPDIDAIHKRVGLLLQAESENASQAEAQISRERFAEVVRTRLREEELDNDETLVRQIIDAAMERLVFLVPVEAEHIGFEIRSLQEFMAAEALLDGREKIVERRLRLIAPLSGWRNVFLFAAGRCFTDLQHYRDTLNTICGELNDSASDPLAPIALPGSRLAIDLLADGVASRQTKYERLLSREALRVAQQAPGDLSDRLAEVYLPVLQPTYEAELRAAVSREVLTEALGAWRTLAVLQARGEDWARDILEAHMPTVDDLDQVFAALPPHAKSPWLSSMLAELSAKALPSKSLPFDEAIKDLEVLDYAPKWFQVLFQLTSAHLGESSGEDLHLEQASKDLVSARLRMVGSPVGPMQEAVLNLDLSERRMAPSSWELLFSGVEFLSSPKAETLSAILGRLAAGAHLELLAGYSGYTSWPLSSLLLTASTGAAELGELAGLVQSGQFGDEGDWMAAQVRWNASGITMSDLARSGDRGFPFDSGIASEGFPLSAATIRVTDSRRKAAPVVLSWFDHLERPEARQFAANVLFWSLGGYADEDDDLGVTFRQVSAVINRDDLEGQEVLPLTVLNQFSWGPDLNSQEVALLDALGLMFEEIDDSGEAIIEGLREVILRALEAEPDRVGLFRLLSIGLHYSADDPRDRLEGLLPGPSGDLAAPSRALLSLKLGIEPDGEDLKALTNGGGAWAIDGIGAIRHLGDVDLRRVMVQNLNGSLSADEWKFRGELASIASSAIGARSSRLATSDIWSSLELFRRAATKAEP
jgi:hypothetical protein